MTHLVRTAVFCLCFLPLVSPLFAQPTGPWQQRVDSDIRVALDDVNHVLNGDIAITYHNESPDALDVVWMHLWPNAYRNGQTAMAKQHFRDGDMLMFYALSRELGGIDSLAFTSNGRALEWSYHPDHIDIARVELPQPLAPGDSLELRTPFRVDLPSGSISRLGHVGESYQITQWFPKPAVYDAEGWHPMPYLSQGEFYSEYGSYDVRLTLPANYTVGATGDLVPGSEDNDAERVRLDSLVAASVEWVASEGWLEDNNDFPDSEEQLKTLHYRQSRVHDFAWFADKRYKVLRGEVELPGQGTKVTTWSMFTPEEGALWQKAPEYLHDATFYYSLWNGDYPYNQVTAVDGTISAGGGMEYPNVTVIGASGSDSGLETVIVHEVGHNWFYGILGSNERENAWMDEGINSFNETRYMVTKYGEDNSISFLLGDSNNLAQRLELEDFKYRWIDELSYLFPARFGVDQPIQCHSNSLTQLNYGAIVYKKTAAAFAMLQAHLGAARFDAAMQLYFDTWKFRHPSPKDLQACMEASSGEDLAWFFEDWIQTTKRNDLKLASVNAKSSGPATVRGIKVRNVGELSSSASVSGLVGDSVVAVVQLSLMAPGELGEAPCPPVEVDRWVLDYERVTLDYNRKDNTRHTGLFGGFEPLQLRMLTRLEDPERTQLFWAPALGWNHYDGFMLGTTLHNFALPWRDVTWRWTPMVGRDRFDDGFNLRGMLAVEGRHGDLSWALKSRRFGAIEFLSTLADLAYTELNPEPLTRTSLGLMYRLNAAPTSPFDATLSAELIHIDGFADDSWWGINEPLRRMAGRAEIIVHHRLESHPGARQSLSLQSTAVQHDGVVEGYLIEPPSTRSTMNRALDAWYHFERTVPSAGRETKWSVDARVVAVEGWNQFGSAPAGSQASFDPLVDALLLHRGADTSSGSWLSRQANMERGGLPLNLVASRGFASLSAEMHLPVGLPISMQMGGAVARNREWGVGTPVAERLHLVASGCLDLGPVRVAVPVWTHEAGTDVWGPAERWRFSLNLLDLNPRDLVRENVK